MTAARLHIPAPDAGRLTRAAIETEQPRAEIVIPLHGDEQHRDDRAGVVMEIATTRTGEGK